MARGDVGTGTPASPRPPRVQSHKHTKTQKKEKRYDTHRLRTPSHRDMTCSDTCAMLGWCGDVDADAALSLVAAAAAAATAAPSSGSVDEETGGAQFALQPSNTRINTRVAMACAASRGVHDEAHRARRHERRMERWRLATLPLTAASTW